MKYVRWLLDCTHGVRWNMAVRVAVGLCQTALGLLMVWLSRRFIDVTIRTGSSADVVRMVTLLVLTVVGGVVLRQIYYYMTTMATTRQTNALRLRIFGGLFRRRLFTDNLLHSGDVTSRLAKDIETVGDVTVDTLPQMAVTTMQLCGSFLLMRWFDARLAWALVLITPLAVVFAKLVAHRLRQMTLDIRKDESRIQMHVQEGMEYNAVLRSLGSEELMQDRLGTMQNHLRTNVLRRTRFSVVTRLTLALAFGLGYLLAFVWGGLGLRDGTITFGVMTSFLQLVGMIQQPILRLLNMVPGLIHATASIDRLEELEQADTEKAATASVPHEGTMGVVMEGVNFRYASGDRMVLDGFSHRFEPGSHTAVMGETGIGKTTLFRLMLGLIEPTAGRVYIEGNGTSVTVGAGTRADFVFVPQGNTLMSGSIRSNLLLAKSDATDEQLTAVLHTACADFVTALPDGLDTELGERGTGLSEGQAQRVAIARGLLRPGSILLLDEISSALDEQTTIELCNRLFSAYSDKTIILITHSSAVGDLCDQRVYVK